MHEVLVNRLGGLSLPRKSVVRLTDRPDMTLDVYRGRKTTIQTNFQNSWHTGYTVLTLLHSEWPKLYGVLAVLSAIGLLQDNMILCVPKYDNSWIVKSFFLRCMGALPCFCSVFTKRNNFWDLLLSWMTKPIFSQPILTWKPIKGS